MPFVEVAGKRFLFVHIPKTGGTTVERWLQTLAPLRLYTFGLPPVLRTTPQHLTYTDISCLLGDSFFDATFALVRNPYDRFASEYKMRHLIAKGSFFGGFPEFPQWVDDITQELRSNPWHLDNHLRPQWQFVSDNVTLFRLEDGIEAAVDGIARMIGVKPPFGQMPKTYGSENFVGEIRWGSKEIDTVRYFYEDDFRRFGYNIDRLPTSASPQRQKDYDHS